jgi:outer membrane autotransporter protein
MANNNWYLTSNGNPTGTSKMASSLPAIHLNIVKTGMNELRRRMGELRDNSPVVKSGAWIRSYAKHLNISEHISSSMNLVGLEGGYDKQIYADCYDKVYLGIMAGYLYTDRIRSKINTGAHASAHANTPSIGAYATWLNKAGWFIDTTLREFWSNMDASSTTTQGNIIKYSPDRNFTTASLEFGRQLRAEHLILEPKVELQYAYAGEKSFDTSIGNKLWYGDTQSINARAALMAAYNIKLENNSIIAPFMEVGLNNEFDGKTKIKYAGGNFRSDLSGTSYDLTAGINAKLTDSLHLYSEAAYEKGSKVEAVSGNIGVRWNW